MEAYRKVQCLGLTEGLLKKRAIHDGEPVVSEAGSSACGQSGQISQFPAGHAFGHIGTAVEVNGERAAALQDILQDLYGIHRGLCVGHQDYRGIAALDSGFRAGGEIFLVGEARIPEMGVGIDEAGADHHSAGIDH